MSYQHNTPVHSTYYGTSTYRDEDDVQSVGSMGSSYSHPFSDPGLFPSRVSNG